MNCTRHKKSRTGGVSPGSTYARRSARTYPATSFRGWRASLGKAFLLLLLTLLPTVALAQTDVELSSRVDRDTVNPGDRLTYELNVSVAGHFSIEMTDGPDLDDFAVHGRFSSPSYRVINGDPHRSLHQEYRLRAPARPGTYTIAAPTFSIGNREFSPDDQTVEVLDDGRARAAPDDDERSEERAFIDVALEPDRDPYVGEQLTAEFTLYTHHRERRLRARGARQPALDGFWAEDVTRDVRRRRARVQRHGEFWYSNPVFTYALFPLSSGSAEIDPVEIPLVRSHVFEDEPEMVVASDPIELDVRPLPDGAPDGFSSANVGSFGFEIDVDADDVAAGDQLRLTARITGTGRIERVGAPAFDVPDDVRLLSTDESHNTWIRDGRIGGQKIVEYRLMPLEEGPTELSPLEFSYFDPDDDEYVTLRSDPVGLDVAPGDVPVFADYDDAQRIAPETKGDPISELHGLLLPGTISADSPDRLTLHLWLTGIPLVALFVLLFGPTILRPVLRRLSPRFRRRALRRRIDAELEGNGDTPTRCLHALQICLRDGLDLSVGALTTDDVAAALASADIPDALASDTAELVDDLVQARYAPASEASGDDALVERTRAAVTDLLDHAFGSDEPDASRGASAALLLLASGLAIAVAAQPAPLEAASPTDDTDDATHSERLAAESPTEWADLAEYWALLAIDEPGDPTYHFNAGTAAAHAGDLGAARLHLERAYATASTERVIRHNLRVVIGAVADESDHVAFPAQRPPATTFYATAPHIAVALLWLAMAMALLRRITGRPSSRAAFAGCIATVVIATVAVAALWLHLDHFPGDAELAIVTTDEAPVFQAPSPHSDPAIDGPLPAGSALLVTGTRDGWVDVELPSGHNGWLKYDAVDPVTP